jgi:hypothetical protein
MSRYLFTPARATQSAGAILWVSCVHPMVITPATAIQNQPDGEAYQPT